MAEEALWDDCGWHVTVRQVALAREAGALDQLAFLLNRMAVEAVWSGDFAAATSLIAEAGAVCEATGSRFAPAGTMMLAAFRGREAEAAPLIQSTIAQATAGGQGVSVTVACWVAAVLYNGLGRYEEALVATRQASGHKHVYIPVWALPELIEAAARTGNPRMAGDAIDWLAGTTRAGGTDLGPGIEARSRALLSEGGHRRRQRRRGKAREQLRTAYQMLDAMGMDGFAERARRELLATGETVAKRAAQPARKRGQASEPLTAQEAQVARLARDGLSNPEIAARLFISVRTVQYHLSKVFTKLGISSRGQLHQILPGEQPSLRI